MPSIPKIFKRRSTSNIRKARDEEAPPLPPLPSDLQGSTPDLPLVIVSPTSLTDNFNNALPGPPTPPVQNSSKDLLKVNTGNSNGMQQMWRSIGDAQAGKNRSKSENLLNKMTDTVGEAVNTASSNTGVVGMIKTITANEEIQAIGQTILDSVPAMMSTLEALTDIHPFLKAAYLPFKFIYSQEVKRRENDRTRTTLFEKIKDVMMVLLELKEIGRNEMRMTSDGQNMLSRVETICNTMKTDIEQCYNVLSAQEKRSLAIKFLQAQAWNGQLAAYAAKFEQRRQELQFALSLRVAAGVDEIKQGMNEMREMFMQMFASFRSPQENELGRWIEQNGGPLILGNSDKCRELIQREATITSATRSRTSATTQLSLETQISALRKDYNTGVKSAIAENMETYTKRFEMGVEQLNEDLSNKIVHQGDRIISYITGGPHKRIRDKIMYHVWKEQGWRGSAKTRQLILALRDYFVERVERSNRSYDSARPPPTPIAEGDEPEDPEVSVGNPLPDSWMTEHLHAKRLRYIQQAFDNDVSGFTTISEVNTFTRARPANWSLPRWIAYWAVGWQIFATKYCIEIEDILRQMVLLRDEIAIKMPGNVNYVNAYISEIWGQVTTLTLGLERYTTVSSTLQEQFQEYIDHQEEILHKRLEKISYDIDAMDTVNLIMGQEHIERVVFIVLTLILRRHLAKIHLCLQQEMNSEELDDDLMTVLWVCEAAWSRYLVLVEIFKHQQIADMKQVFDYFSCGLFSKYWAWKDWTNKVYYKTNIISSSGDETNEKIKPLDPSKLTNILIHETQNDLPDNGGELRNTHKSDSDDVVKTEEPDSPVYDIAGDWYGYQWSTGESPFTPMLCITLRTSISRSSSVSDSSSATEFSQDKKHFFAGHNISQEGITWTIKGTFTISDPATGYLPIEFSQTHPEGMVQEFKGILSPVQDIITNVDSDEQSKFLFNRTPVPVAICHRPLVMKMNPKQLWRFAYQTVVDQQRRSRLSLMYIFRRITTIKRYLQLLHGADELESGELAKIRMSFTPIQSREIMKLSTWYERVGNAQQWIECDSCEDSITRSRVLCLDCKSTDPENPGNSVDFCFKAGCIAANTLVNRSDVKHESSHLLVKIREFLLLKDYYMLDTRARKALKAGNHLYKKCMTPPAEEDRQDSQGSFLQEIQFKVDISGVLTESPVSDSTGSFRLNRFSRTLDSSVISTSISKDRSPGTMNTVPGDDAIKNEDMSMDVPETEREKDRLRCMICQTKVVASCWKCIYCRDVDSFVCDGCEEATDNLYPWDFQKRYRSEIAKDKLAHNVFHALVRYRLKFEDEVSGETKSENTADRGETAPLQWTSIEERLWQKMDGIIQQRLEQLENRVEKRITAIEERMSSQLARIESLLLSTVKPQAGV